MHEIRTKLWIKKKHAHAFLHSLCLLNVVEVWCSKHEYLHNIPQQHRCDKTTDKAEHCSSLFWVNISWQMLGLTPGFSCNKLSVVCSTSNTICTFHSHRCVSSEGSTKRKNSSFIWSPIYTLYILCYSILLFWLHSMVWCVLVFRIRV